MLSSLLRGHSSLDSKLFRVAVQPSLLGAIHVGHLPSRACSSAGSSQSPVASSQLPPHITKVRSRRKRKLRERAPVDWLPFKWEIRPLKNWFIESGDYVQTLEYDPAWPKPDFELSEELKTASPDIQRIFSLANGSKADIKEVVKRNYLKKVQRHPTDYDSLEVKIAMKTLQIRSLFDHARVLGKKEILGSRIILHNVIHQRNRMLKILYRTDTERFEWLTEELQIYYVPEQLGGRKEHYSKKWDLRRLTKEYSENMVKSKKEAYHEELKQQQKEFLQEKAEIMAWIEKEEKELEALEIK